ncbi:MAG: Fe-S cluster assembly protein SufB, partial [Allobaculum sp.]|nr:Fe-S cluster assembly protein SufB [Allobaculum sp.]
MAEKHDRDEVQILQDDTYKYGFHDEDTSVFKTKKGLNEEVIREISAVKKEPQWMLDRRLDAYHAFLNQKNPTWGPDLSEIDFDDFTYYIKPSEKQENDWDDVPET